MRLRSPKELRPHRLDSSHIRQHHTAKLSHNLDMAGAVIYAARLVPFNLATVVITVAGRTDGDPYERTLPPTVRLANDGIVCTAQVFALILCGIGPAPFQSTFGGHPLIGLVLARRTRFPFSRKLLR